MSTIPTPATPLPDDLDGLLPEAPLTPVQAQLRHVARELLAPVGILVRATEALPFGLRLYLSYQVPQPGPDTGQLVLYHNQRGEWTKTVAEGLVTPLAQTAVRHLVATGTAPEVPLW